MPETKLNVSRMMIIVGFEAHVCKIELHWKEKDFMSSNMSNAPIWDSKSRKTPEKLNQVKFSARENHGYKLNEIQCYHIKMSVTHMSTTLENKLKKKRKRKIDVSF